MSIGLLMFEVFSYRARPCSTHNSLVIVVYAKIVLVNGNTFTIAVPVSVVRVPSKSPDVVYGTAVAEIVRASDVAAS